ncbi:MAG: hypothetical protein U1D55_18970 [Phycisphaerae bacterium]
MIGFRSQVVWVVALAASCPVGFGQVPSSASSDAPALTANSPIWLQAGPQARQLALEAARRDARLQLAQQIAAMRVKPDLCVVDLSTTPAPPGELLAGLLVAAKETGAPRLRDDALLLELPMSLPADQAVAAVRRLSVRAVADGRIDAGELDRWLQSAMTRDLEIVGVGAPPPAYWRRVASIAGAALPGWVLQNIEAEGEAGSPEASPASRRTALRTAELEARGKLAESVRACGMDEQRSVGALAGRSAMLARRLDELLAQASIASVRADDAGARITLSLPGFRVWALLQEAGRERSAGP